MNIIHLTNYFLEINQLLITVKYYIHFIFDVGMLLFTFCDRQTVHIDSYTNF